MSWTKLVNNAALRNKQRLEDAGISTDGTEHVAGPGEIEDKLPGVTLPQYLAEAVAKHKESL